MKSTVLDENWLFCRNWIYSEAQMAPENMVSVNLPHDAMISTPVSKDAPAGVDSGYYKGGEASYTKYVYIPEEWADGCVGLYFDGAMTKTDVDVNGSKVASAYYGYAPFYVDLTDYVAFGNDNRITVNTLTPIRPGSRWYPGNGLFRGVRLCHGPKVHIDNDGIFVYTREVSDGYAFLEGAVDVVNASTQNRIVKVDLSFYKEGFETPDVTVSRTIQVNPRAKETAHMAVNLKNPMLWSAESPNLYTVKATVTDLGEFRTHLIKDIVTSTDEYETLFGVRTITADSVHGLRINCATVKLKGGCVHHDNGLLGAVSLYECEARKIRKLKELGFNAIRTTHNPMSEELIEACDRLGMYVFDEAFDCWDIPKRIGDYASWFEAYSEKDLTAFVRRDRKHPSVIIWSTGNEIPNRGGLCNGYTTATKLAMTIKALDPSRPVSNGICSFWSGLDDELAKGVNSAQNATDEESLNTWEAGTEPFTNGLDIVGYNYMEDLYEKDHEMYPERVILGSENFPKEIGFRWPMVEKLPYVIGDFTWTAWDYLGEAGIGKAIYVDPDDPMAGSPPWEIMPDKTSPYPWRTANDSDYDICGRLRPQGAYRSVVFGSKQAHLYSYHPSTYGKVELSSLWGFPELYKSWNFEDFEGKPVEVMVFSNADEAALIFNGEELERKTISQERPYPNSAVFEILYRPGKLEAVCYKDGKEISRDALETSGPVTTLRLVPEKTEILADGHDCVFVGIDVLDASGRLVPDAKVSLDASFDGLGTLSGFGTGNPVTEEIYTDFTTVTYHGHATAVIRSGYEKGTCTLTVTSAECGTEEIKIDII